MKSFPTAWAFAFVTACILTGCEGGSTEVLTPGDVTAQQEAEARLETQEVENAEKLHQLDQQGQ